MPVLGKCCYPPSSRVTFPLLHKEPSTHQLRDLNELTRLHRTSTYTYDTTAGAGTFAYVIDTGVNAAHVDFGGRASLGYNAVNTDPNDANGHGTHVSGTIAGATYGVSKSATIIAVKVFAGSGGTVSDVLEGFDCKYTRAAWNIWRQNWSR